MGSEDAFQDIFLHHWHCHSSSGLTGSPLMGKTHMRALGSQCCHWSGRISHTTWPRCGVFFFDQKNVNRWTEARSVEEDFLTSIDSRQAVSGCWMGHDLVEQVHPLDLKPISIVNWMDGHAWSYNVVVGRLRVNFSAVVGWWCLCCLNFWISIAFQSLLLSPTGQNTQHLFVWFDW